MPNAALTPPRIYAISFGSDRQYEIFAYDLLRELSLSYPSISFKIFTRDHLPPPVSSKAAEFKTGFGYFVWKPWVVSTAISQLNDGDILLYVDGRSGLRNPGQPIKWLDAFVQDTRCDLAAWQMSHLESLWSTGDLIDSLEMSDEAALQVGQYAATFHAWRINERTRGLAESWYQFMMDNFQLCRNEPSLRPNHAEFRENRHDQSVFSLMLKRKALDGHLNVMTLAEPTVLADNLRPHRKRHPLPKHIYLRLCGYWKKILSRLRPAASGL
jgi:hypothetical protein